jgi:TonB family protein
MYFDLEDHHPDYSGIGSAISWREGILLSIIFHLVVIIGFLLMPSFPASEPDQAILAQEAAERERQREAQRFVFVQPRLDVESPKPPPRADASDKDRLARSPEQAPRPTNIEPFARGNSPERVEAAPAAPPAVQPQRAETAGQNGDRTPDASSPPESARTLTLPPGQTQAPPQSARLRSGAGPGLGDSLRNLQRYIPPQESFDNPEGNSPFGPQIQFDTKGVEFGPWVRRFIAQIKRNWFIPYAAMAMRGHTVLQFNVHKNGSITDLVVAAPSSVDAFNNAAYNAMASSNPTQPLPPEYPSEQAFFTVTFYYNETPPR